MIEKEEITTTKTNNYKMKQILVFGWFWFCFFGLVSSNLFLFCVCFCWWNNNSFLLLLCLNKFVFCFVVCFVIVFNFEGSHQILKINLKMCFFFLCFEKSEWKKKWKNLIDWKKSFFFWSSQSPFVNNNKERFRKK